MLFEYVEAQIAQHPVRETRTIKNTIYHFILKKDTGEERSVFSMQNETFVLNDQHGFTLLEAILSMLILSVIMGMIPFIFQYFLAFDRIMTVEEDFEWNLFLIDYRNEIKDAEKLFIYSNRTIAEKNTISYMYEIYGTQIRRRVSAKGNEVILQNIKTFKFSKEDHFIFIDVEFFSGAKEQARFFIADIGVFEDD